jgi:hypothetical protein
MLSGAEKSGSTPVDRPLLAGEAADARAEFSVLPSSAWLSLNIKR